MPNLGSNFYPKLVRIASELGMKPEDILAIMVSESGLNPSSVEHKYKGSGLIGFMPSTLKNLGFKGTWEDFTNVSGEDQLDYVKKYISNSIQFNGAPFKSAAQYYVANFWPVALKLPGIKAEDPQTVFVEENPPVVRTSDGRRYSKKYYDIGFKIDPKQERSAYMDNKLFHGSTPGAITYGDMVRQVERNRSNPLYQQAMHAMHDTTGYQAPTTPTEPSSTESLIVQFLKKIEDLVSKFSHQSTHRYLITVGSSSNHYVSMEYARVLTAALADYLDAKATICADHNNINIECLVAGNKQRTFDAIKELSAGVTDAFQHATAKLGNISAFALVIADHCSDYPPLHPKRADLCARQFQLKLASTQYERS